MCRELALHLGLHAFEFYERRIKLHGMAYGGEIDADIPTHKGLSSGEPLCPLIRSQTRKYRIRNGGNPPPARKKNSSSKALAVAALSSDERSAFLGN